MNTPGGTTRIADHAVHSVATAAVREVRGVLDVQQLASGALVGGAIGSVVGGLSAGVGGAVVGASLGTAAGVAAVHLAAQHRAEHWHDAGTPVPELEIHVSAAYGEDLERLATEAQQRVRDSVADVLGLDVKRVHVVITDIVDVDGPWRDEA